MYCDFFGLRCRPFEDRADPHFYYPTAETEEAIAAMEYESHYGRGLGLILGESGTGKTLLARTLLQRLSATDHVVILTSPGHGAIDLVREACKRFGVTLPSTPNAGRYLARLRRHLERTRKDDHRSILILDQAENLTIDGLTQLTTLCDLPHDGAPLLRIVLCAQPRFREIVGGPDFASFRQRLCGERTLPALSRVETESYLLHRQRVAGAGDGTLFDAEAVSILHQVSGGVPRLVSYYADAALLATYAAGECRVSASLAMEVTTQGTQRQRTLDACELGIPSVSEVAAGRTPRTPYRNDSRQTVAPMTATKTGHSIPFAPAPSMYTDPASGGAVIRDSAITDSSMTLATTPTAPATLTDHETLLCRIEAAIARAERTVAATDAGIAKYAAIEQHLMATTTRAERVAGTLSGFVERAGDAADRVQRPFKQTVAEAATLADRLDGLTQLLPRAQATESAVRQTADHATATLEKLEAAIGSSTRTEGSLREVQAGAQRALVDFAGLKRESDTTSQRMHDQLARVEKSIQLREPLLHGFVEQTRNLGAYLNRIEPNVRELERAVQLATSQPIAILEAAQTQAAQLEQVCSAVQKVFRSLSKTSLDAARQSAEFKRIGDAAAAKLAHLRAETERAQATLREWVEEAIRAQSRIEKALQQLPTVHETHPGEAFRGMARLLDAPVNTSAQARAVEGCEEGSVAFTESEVVRHVLRPRTRTEEIAALIEDARRASEQQAETVS